MHTVFPRAILTLLAAAQAVLMMVIELNRTHATHPKWPGHARFHLVWQNLTSALLSILVIALLWWPGDAAHERFFIAAAIAGIPLLGFAAAAWSRGLYGGTMADPGGVPPMHLRRRLHSYQIDGNTLAVIVGSLLLLLAIFTYR